MRFRSDTWLAGVTGALVAFAFSGSAYAQGRADVGANPDEAPVTPHTRERSAHAEGDPAKRSSVVYAQGEAGYETLALHTLRAVNQFPTEVQSSTSGTLYGIGAGVRLGFLTLGGRYRASRLTGLDLTTVNGEVGARIPINRFEPYVLLGVGYARMNARGQALADTADVAISGFNGRAGVGLDFFPDPRVSLGASFMGEALAMTRPGFSATQDPQTQAQNRLMTCTEARSLPAQRSCALGLLSDAEGSSYAFGATVSLVMGLHF